MRAADHKLLSETGAGTPMGNLLRRYWTAALLSRELPENDGAPVRVRLLGEDLVAFRESNGKVGLLGEHLLPPRRLAVLRREQGMRAALLVPRLEIRRGGQLRRHAEQAAGQGLQAQGQAHGLPVHREERRGVRLYGPGQAAEAARARMAHRARQPRLRLQAAAALPLDAGDGRRHRRRASVVPARQDRRARQGAGPAGLELGRLDQGRHPPDLPHEEDRRAHIARDAAQGGRRTEYYYRVNQWFMPGYTTIPLPGDGTLAGHSLGAGR